MPLPLRLPAAALFAAALLLAAIAASCMPAGPARAANFIDSAGRRVMLPAYVARVMPAERNAEVLVYVLAPDKLAGLERTAERLAPLPRRPREATIDWVLRSTPAEMAATARRLHADLIIDAGAVTPQRVAFADQVQQETGIPYILVDDSFARMPAMLRTIGAILGIENRADRLGRYADHAISGLRGRMLITPADTRPRVYYGLGYDGLTTALPGSPAGMALDEAGVINVAWPLGRGGEVRITPRQLLAWNPDVVIAEPRGFYDALRRNPRWRGITAVREGRVYLEPTAPFGWIEDPSGINRLIGLQWLSTLFYPSATAEDLRTAVCEFYDLFYRIKLTNAAVEDLVRPAGAPPQEAGLGYSEPLVGLGAAPPSALAPAPATPITPVTPGAPGARTPPAPAGPNREAPLPGLPNNSPSATCSIPTETVQQPLLPGLPPGLTPAPGGTPPAAPAPGAAPPGGQRSGPRTELTEPGMTAEEETR
jgi:iron complex transport system substrate-binding protein